VEENRFSPEENRGDFSVSNLPFKDREDWVSFKSTKAFMGHKGVTEKQLAGSFHKRWSLSV
jgi:hypothetical protein